MELVVYIYAAPYGKGVGLFLWFESPLLGDRYPKRREENCW